MIQFVGQNLVFTRSKPYFLYRLKDVTDNPSRYIRFFGLRDHAIMPNGRPAQELVYVHSKMMIVDDSYALIGSANINDRSMLGDRDSELAIVIKDKKRIVTEFGGKQFRVRKFAHKLRRDCFVHLFGLSDEEVADPLSTDLWDKIKSRTKKNEQVYLELFGAVPHDSIKNYSEVAPLKHQPSVEEYKEKIKDIEGYAVPFPLRFLENENLKELNFFQVENLAPVTLCT